MNKKPLLSCLLLLSVLFITNCSSETNLKGKWNLISSSSEKTREISSWQLPDSTAEFFSDKKVILPIVHVIFGRVNVAYIEGKWDIQPDGRVKIDLIKYHTTEGKMVMINPYIDKCLKEGFVIYGEIKGKQLIIKNDKTGFTDVFSKKGFFK